MRAFRNAKIDSAVSLTPLSFDLAVSVTPLSFDLAVSITPLNHGAKWYIKIDFHWLSGVTGDLKLIYLGKLTNFFETILGCKSEAKGEMFDEKNRRSKSSWDCPFKLTDAFCYWVKNYRPRSLKGFSSSSVTFFTFFLKFS